MTELQKAKERSKGLTNNQTSLKETIKSGEFLTQISNALPEGNLSAKRYISACLTALAVQPKLMQCKPASVLKAMMESARFGLEPNSPLSEAALIPYGQECTFLIEYRGMMKLAWNTGLIKSLDYDKVCDGDEFDYSKGSNGLSFHHRPKLSSSRGEGSIYYAYAELKHGGAAFQIMTRDDIVAHAKHFSRGYSSESSPWQTDFDAMAYKTVIRQLCDKKLPKSTTENGILMSEAAHIDDLVEDDEPRHIVMQKNELEVNEDNSYLETSSFTTMPEFEDEDPAEKYPQEIEN
jgi:recombination protein RecT|tara:strand:+ start:80 stop:955 length:876 start_codon:yes stop_codon:yes gene_type:complete